MFDKDPCCKPREWLTALLNQLVIPYLGFQSIRNPGDKEIHEKHWRYKVNNSLYLFNGFELIGGMTEYFFVAKLLYNLYNSIKLAMMSSE